MLVKFDRGLIIFSFYKLFSDVDSSEFSERDQNVLAELPPLSLFICKQEPIVNHYVNQKFFVEHREEFSSTVLRKTARSHR